jgi:lipopolysaccharide cholinephosphotransferase
MIEFESSYFQEEVRWDFTVSEMMKRVWAVEQDVMAEIIRVCKKYGLTYYADYGTLLGTIRHHGFVPWDDDMDIAMKRADYEKLFRLLPEELPKTYGIHSIYNEEDHNQPLGCVTNSKVINTDPEVVASFHGCPYIVGIDVYPLDYIPRDAELASTHRSLYNAVYDAAQRYEELNATGELAQYLPKLEEFCEVRFDNSRPLRPQLWKLADRIAGLFREEECDVLMWMPDTILSDSYIPRKKEWYQSAKELPFEKIMMSVPNGYHEILTAKYGDYMTPQQGVCAHEYPFYKSQEELLMRLQKKEKTGD